MELRELLSEIGKHYDRTLDFTSRAQRLLKNASDSIAPVIPAGYIVEGSGGRGNTAVVPWIAIFDPDETTTARRGMYVVYLFDAHMNTVALSLNQGVTEVVDRYGTRDGRRRLALQAQAIREALDSTSIAGLDISINLQSREALPLHYECGNILAVTYSIESLPENTELMNDLRRLLRIYEIALQVRAELRLSTNETIITTVKTPYTMHGADEFKPKDDSDYLQKITAQIIRKTRKHETLVAEYGYYLRTRGFSS